MRFATGARLGRFEILAPLGAGGMGEVYRARDPQLGRYVAIKVLPPHLAEDPVARERLRREAMAAAALDDPFICKIFEIGDDERVVFIVMEYVAGETLRARLAAGHPSLAEALHIAQELAEALEEAHSRHFVHRDLKPANVMLTPQGHVKIMDFGLAKRVELPVTDATVTALTQTGMAIGTPHYMSPEQIKGGEVDQRSDLFSFGILLCELFGGENPFQRSTAMDTISAILRDPPQLPGQLPPGLMVLIRRLLAKPPAERYQSMREVRADLMRVATVPLFEEAPAGARIPLIGRDNERAELLRALDQAMAGHGSLVMIGGEPGIGKTHLTRTILDEARRCGAFGVVGHCYEMEGSPPYVPFVEILEASARAAPPESFRYALGDAAPEIAKILPELRRIYPGTPAPLQLPPEQQRRFLFNAYRDFSERAARVTPIVAVFEDLHWADEPTLLLLQHLAQTVAGVPTLLIGTYRDVELDVTRPFAGVLETLTRERLAKRVNLRRLPVGGVEAMLEAMGGSPPPPQLLQAVFEETEGNPFFVEEIFRHLSEEGRLFEKSGAWRKDLQAGHLEVPEGVRLVIGKRLQRLSEEGRRVLSTAAVIGRSFSLGVLEELESARPDAALEALEEAERAHLVTAESRGREAFYRFTHELIRQTLTEALSLPRRQRLHARIGAAMEKRYGATVDKQAPAIAHHLYQAGTAADSQKTLNYLLRAADGASGSAAHEEALSNLDDAISLLEGETGAAVADLQERRGSVLRSLGRMSEAVAAYELAFEMFEALGERVRAASVCCPLSWILGWTSNIPRMDDTIQRALQILGETGESSLKSLLLTTQGWARIALGLVDQGLHSLQRAESMFTPSTGAEVYLWQGYAYWGIVDIARSRDFLRKATEALQFRNNPWIEAELGHCSFAIRNHTGPLTAPREVEPFLEKAIRIGHQDTVYMLRLALDTASLARAHPGFTPRSARETLAYGESIQSRFRFAGHLNLALIEDMQDRDDAMRDCMRRACECEPEHSEWSGVSKSIQFRLSAIRGDAESARRLHNSAVSMPVLGRPNRFGAWWALSSAVEGLAALGRVEDVGALRDLTEALLQTGARFLLPFSTRTTAGIASACLRDWSRAEEHHRAAIQDADAESARVTQAMTRAWYAEMLASQGEVSRAREMLREALGIYESIGMPGYARRASERLARL